MNIKKLIFYLIIILLLLPIKSVMKIANFEPQYVHRNIIPSLLYIGALIIVIVYNIKNNFIRNLFSLILLLYLVEEFALSNYLKPNLQLTLCILSSLISLLSFVYLVKHRTLVANEIGIKSKHPFRQLIPVIVTIIIIIIIFIWYSQPLSR